MSSARSDPGNRGSVTEILADLMSRSNAEWEDVVERACAAYPHQADAIRRRYRIIVNAGFTLHPLGTEGNQLFGKFRIVRKIGAGGMGRVFLAEQPTPPHQVALKLIREDLLAYPEARARFRREVELASSLEHPGICPIYESGEIDNVPYVAMRYVQGRTLAEQLRTVRARSEPCEVSGPSEGASQPRAPRADVTAVTLLIEKIARILHAAHEAGLIHRDIKPHNVMLGADGEPVILDFGLARPEQDPGPGITRTDQVLGTPAYMSPEQIRSSGDRLDRRVDVYSLGVTLFECLTLELPFRGATSEEIHREILAARAPDCRRLNPAISRDLKVVIDTAIERDRERRYRSALELAEDLRRLREFEPIHARPAGAVLRVRRWAQRNPIVATVLIALLVGIMAVAWQWSRAEENLSRFNLLSNVVKLRKALKVEEELYPAEPSRASDMRHWLKGPARELKAQLPYLEGTLAMLRQTARPQTDEERTKLRRTHPLWRELDGLQRKLGALVRAQEAREGTAEPVDVVPGEEYANDSYQDLRDKAWPFISPNEYERRYGQEALGLALAKRLVDQVKDADPQVGALMQITLAWAWFANGRDDQALQAAEETLAMEPPAGFRGLVDRLREAVKEAKEKGRSRFGKLEKRVARLEAEVSNCGWSFQDEDSQFLHDTMAQLVQDLREFVDPVTGPAARVAERLAWADQVHQRTIGDHQAAWREAIAAIKASDGVRASAAYRHFELEEQLGLVPLGMDPVSKLWEFYFLFSATDTDRIPQRDGEGRLPKVDERMGMVLVLVPAGTFLMGSQKEHRAKAHYDPDASPNESPVKEVALDAYFLAKHEVTQGQWKKLTGGVEPSAYMPGYGGDPVTMANPVENVSWNTCDLVLRRHGFRLPTEAQWEYACRAGTDTRWYTGNGASSLQHHANLRDQTASEATRWGPGEPFRDGCVVHKEVGSFRPNGFGFHDMHGNVAEWCADRLSPYWAMPRPGDGLRDDPDVNRRIVRGGSHIHPALLLRCAHRNAGDPALVDTSIGVRPARAVTKH
jgi:serine/threonine protein kinase/formylglycine-generating enzyme required for sulfatase activity